jgi:YhcH/YjgK/YiaL family protein
MKSNTIYSLILFAMAFSCTHPASRNPENWNERELEKWVHAGEWKYGWEIFPDQTINKKELAIRFFENRERWEKAFNYLKTNNLEKISIGRHELDGADLFVNVDEYTTKNEEDTRFEAHREYIDIQYLVYGEEKIGIAALSNTTEIIPYDSLKDITFLHSEQNNYHVASPDRFFVFFPNDAHRPCVKTDENSKVRKVVVKIKIK